MNHLTETQLNEYLDEALSAPERTRVEAHLSGCATCRAELAALQNVFQALAGLPEQALTRDLGPSIQKSIAGPKLALGWRLALAVQAGLALGIFILFGRLASSLSGLTRPEWDFRPVLAAWIGLVSQVSSALPHPVFHGPVLPTLQLPIPVPATISLLAVVLVVCGLGTARLLRNGSSLVKK